jgi:hypothetical protein
MAFPNGVHLKGGAAAAPVHRQHAAEFYGPLLPIVAELHGAGMSLRAIAAELARRGIKTRQEWMDWSATQVRRVLARAVAAGFITGWVTPPVEPRGGALKLSKLPFRRLRKDRSKRSKLPRNGAAKLEKLPLRRPRR